jgi:hypothetical protein
MNKALLERYRFCPDFVDFQLSNDLSAQPGYFRFGEGAIGYGFSSTDRLADHVSGNLMDIRDLVRTVGSTCYLPFNPTDVIDNLRFERYANPAKRKTREFHTHPAIKDAYYFLRPLLPISLRRRLQQIVYSDWNRIPFPAWPVDRSVENILETLVYFMLKSLGVDKIPFIWFWPDGYSSCILMTHDVETSAGKEFCSNLMDIDDSAGIKSCFQLIPEGGYFVESGFLEGIRSRGFEINVHDLNHDGNLYRSKKEFLRRAQKINQYARQYGALGFRSGALYRNLDWYDALEFSYDMSVPNAAHLEPQRGGCCTVMPYFAGKIVVLPSTMAQDYALFYLIRDYSIDLWSRQLDLIQEKNGLAAVICHPDYLSGRREQILYGRLLDLICNLRNDQKAWIALPSKVAAWWRLRGNMNLVREGQEWRIDGPGSDRARIAYACLAGDGIEYTL